ncbi:MAG: prepilin peptidase [Alphaproteobacteria bacterium]|nr:prepilin peptidase [Alphaproteobacteria bacterium]
MAFTPFLLNYLLFIVLMGMSLKDIKDGIIPDVLLGIIFILGLLRFGGNHSVSVVILGILAYALYKIYPLLRGKEGLGFGDVKLMAVSGVWIDPFQIPLYLVISGGLGVGIAVLWYTLKKGKRFPLGPALALSLGICSVGNHGLSKGENNMTLTFSGPRLSPASGHKPDSIVVLIHGYGADGDDLLSLGKAWASFLPNTLFVAPHGPSPSELNPYGKQWFGLGDWNLNKISTPPQTARMLKEVQSLTPSFNRYLDELLKAEGLPPEKLALVGFSQGAMLALHIALHRPLCAGVVAYSGAFLNDPTEVIMARPSVLLVHGMDDQLLPPFFSQAAEEGLKHLHVPVTLTLLPGLEHGIDGRALGMGGAFLKDRFHDKAPSGLWEQAKEGSN